MNLIIGRTELLQREPVSKGIPDDYIAKVTKEAQLEDLRCLVGDSLFFYILANLSDDGVKKLLDGDDFTYNGVTMEHYGLKGVLASYIMARIALDDIKSTSFNMVVKKTDWSESADSSSRRDLAKQKKNYAFSQYQLIEKYMSTVDQFKPYLQNGGCGCSTKTNCSNPNITVI